MSIESAYNSLRYSLASKHRRGSGAPSDEAWRKADMEIDRMSNTELMGALIQHEEDSE